MQNPSRTTFGIYALATALLFAGGTAVAAPAPADPESEIIARRLYREAVAYSENRPGRGTERFEEIVKRFPDTIWAQRAERWLGNNRILSIKQMTDNGPAENRIDVAVMGDGFQYGATDMRQFQRLSDELLVHYFRSEVLNEYACCFNFHKVMLASHDDRVDYRNHEYDTALDGRKLDDDRHIVVDRRLVRHYLDACEWNDMLAFAIVREGGLGTGGGGVATVGKDLGTVVPHEWGHAFAGLADEYSHETSPRGTPTRGPNISSSPDPRNAPWAHWHKRYPSKYKAHEGGAGVYKGVWRPTPDGCLMRSAHDFCAICREALVLKIYSYVRPIDSMTATDEPVAAVAGGDKVELHVFPIVPRSHRLQVEWSVAPQGHPDFNAKFPDRWKGEMPGVRIGGQRDTVRKRPRHFVEIQNLYVRRKIGTGSYRIFARVTDTAEVRRKTWVLEDKKGLLTQMVSWTVNVRPPPPKPPPAVDLGLTVVPLLRLGRLSGFDCTAAVHNRPRESVGFRYVTGGLGHGLPLGPPESATARDARDAPLEAEPDGTGGFLVPNSAGNFAFNWKSPTLDGDHPEGAGAAEGQTVPSFVVDSGELFLSPDGVRPGRIEVAFSLPPGWDAVLPWADLGESYRIPTVDSMERNVFCLGDWNERESLTRHVLLRTAVAPRLESSGTSVNALFNKILTSTGGLMPFPSGRVVLVVADVAPEGAQSVAPEGAQSVAPDRSGFRVVRGADSLLYLFPPGYNAARPGAETEFDLLELAAYEFMVFFGRRAADRSAEPFFEAVYRFLALRAAAVTETREDRWYRTRAARYLARLTEGQQTDGAATAFATGFFLDQTLIRLGGEGKGLADFLAHLGPVPGKDSEDPKGGKPMNLAEVLRRLSDFAGFDVLPFWNQLARPKGGPDVMTELGKCGLEFFTDRDGLTIREVESR